MNMVIPVTIIDDFFDDPMAIVQYALEQEYLPDPENKWPGVRTDSMHNLNQNLFEQINSKLLRIFYPGVKYSYICGCFFQKVPANFNSGWIHRDESIVSGIIYLNPNPNPNSGTTIYKCKTPWATVNNIKEKQKAYSLQTNDMDAMEKNNSQFRESIIVKNEFNRLIAFDGHTHHGANDFDQIYSNEERLTIAFFIYSIQSITPYPMIRLRAV